MSLFQWSSAVAVFEEQAGHVLDRRRRGGAIPRELISAIERGFKSMMPKSPRLGVPVVGVHAAMRSVEVPA